MQYGSLYKRAILMKQSRREGKLQLLEGAVIAKESGNGIALPLTKAR